MHTAHGDNQDDFVAIVKRVYSACSRICAHRDVDNAFNRHIAASWKHLLSMDHGLPTISNYVESTISASLFTMHDRSPKVIQW